MNVMNPFQKGRELMRGQKAVVLQELYWQKLVNFLDDINLDIPEDIKIIRNIIHIQTSDK